MMNHIDSRMLYQEGDLSSNCFEPTISFGKLLKYKKNSYKQTENSVRSFQESKTKGIQIKPKLSQIFKDYLDNPHFSYTLQFIQTAQQNVFVDESFNPAFGIFTKSIETQQFRQMHQIDNFSPQSFRKPQSPRFTKISSILKMIEEKKKQKYCQIQDNKFSFNKKQKRNETNIQQDKENINPNRVFSKRCNKQTCSKNQSDMTLGLQSKLQNKISQNSHEKIMLSKNKSEQRIKSLEILSPVLQNPERKLLKIKSSNEKQTLKSKNSPNKISGLQFSKKQRKKNLNNRKLLVGTRTSDFNVNSV